MKTASKIPTAGVPIRLADRSFGRSSANGNLDGNSGIPQRPQRTSFGSKSSLWNQWKSAFLQRASEEAPTHRQLPGSNVHNAKNRSNAQNKLNPPKLTIPLQRGNSLPTNSVPQHYTRL